MNSRTLQKIVLEMGKIRTIYQPVSILDQMTNDIIKQVLQEAKVTSEGYEQLKKMVQQLKKNVCELSEIICCYSQKPDDPRKYYEYHVKKMEDTLIWVIQDKTQETMDTYELKKMSNFKKSIVETAEFYLEVDLILEKIIETNLAVINNWFLNTEYTLERILNYYKIAFVMPEDHQIFIKYINPQKYIEVFNQEKKTYFTFDIRVRLPKIHDYHWMQMTILLWKNPVDEHIVFFIYGKDINEQKSEAIKMEYQAERDSLTGLYNRRAFKEYIEEAMQKKDEIGALFMLDVDQFKRVNDTWGHSNGDKVLQDIAATLENIFRKNDIIARIGGDEMAIYMSDLKNVESKMLLELVKKRGIQICKDVEKIKICDESFKMSVSVGIALFPAHGNRFEVLYKEADAALYYSKRKGKNRASVFNEGL